MRLLPLLSLAPFVLQAAPPLDLAEAANQILEAFDNGIAPEALPRPLVKPKDRPSLDWLRAALGETPPRNPFPNSSRSHKEAESVRAMLEAPPEQFSALLRALKPTLAGSHAALWRRGQAHTRKGAFTIPQRQAWENLLMAQGGPLVIRGLAFRHALCFALAEGDETRLMALKTAYGDELPNFFQPFQRAFALLGGPAPRLYLWSLPELQPLDLSLSRMGSRIYISFPETPAPPDAAWIIPAPTSNLSTDLSELDPESLKEAKQVAEKVRAMERKAYFAPSHPPLEALALVYFPIDIQLNAAGLIQSIRMGDAALAQSKTN